jgi:hypothetical protein
MRAVHLTSTLVLWACLAAAPVAAQSLSPPTATRIDSGRGDLPNALTSDAAGQAYVAGSVDDRQRATQFAVIKIDAQGRIVWRSHDNGAFGGPVGRASAVAVDRQGNVYATGTVLTTVGITSTTRSLLAAFDASGRQLWSREVGGAKVAVDAADRVIVTGRGGETAQFNAAGTLLWSRAAAGLSVTDMRLDAGGAVLISGVAGPKTTLNAHTIVALKLDPQGNLVWRSTFDSSAIGDDVAAGIAPAPDGGAWIVGSTALDASGEIAPQPLLLKLDGGGVATVAGIGPDYGGQDIAVAPTGDVTVFGQGVASRLTSNGAIVWTTSVGSLSTAMAVGSNGDVFVSGALATARISAAGVLGTAVAFSDPS